MLTKAERKQLEKQHAYHVACIAQYRASAATLKSKKLSLRAMDNAQFHERRLQYVAGELNRR